MASGYAPYILQMVSDIAGAATPQYKINAHGFLGMLVTTGSPDKIQVGNYDGNKKTVNVAWRQRFTKAQTDTSASCDNFLIPSKVEGTVSVGNTRQIAVHLEDGLLELYKNEQAARVNLPGAAPATGASAEMADIIFSAANAILEGCNSDLVGLVTFGKHPGGTAAASTCDWPKDSTLQYDQSKGFAFLAKEYSLANYSGRPQVVGSGISLGVFQALSRFATSANLSGISNSLAAGAFDYYHDREFPTGIPGGGGADNFGVFEPGSLQLVQYLQYTGWQAGMKPDGSEFFVLPLPILDPTNNMVNPVKFDVQLKYSSCPQTYTDAYSGTQSLTVQKGWTLFIRKQFGLWQIPPSAFRGEDPSYGMNGSLLYNATNS